MAQRPSRVMCLGRLPYSKNPKYLLCGHLPQNLPWCRFLVHPSQSRDKLLSSFAVGTMILITRKNNTVWAVTYICFVSKCWTDFAKHCCVFIFTDARGFILVITNLAHYFSCVADGRGSDPLCIREKCARLTGLHPHDPFPSLPK